MKSPKKISVVNRRPSQRPLKWSVDLSLAALTKGKRLWSKRGTDNTVAAGGPGTWLTNL
jgi:hypothetical protein